MLRATRTMVDRSEHFQAFITSISSLLWELLLFKCQEICRNVLLRSVILLQVWNCQWLWWSPGLCPKIDLKSSPDLFFFPAESPDQWLSANYSSLCRTRRWFLQHWRESRTALSASCDSAALTEKSKLGFYSHASLFEGNRSFRRRPAVTWPSLNYDGRVWKIKCRQLKRLNLETKKSCELQFPWAV